MASQLSKKAALPLAKIFATCRNNVSNTGPSSNAWPVWPMQMRTVPRFPQRVVIFKGYLHDNYITTVHNMILYTHYIMLSWHGDAFCIIYWHWANHLKPTFGVQTTYQHVVFWNCTAGDTWYKNLNLLFFLGFFVFKMFKWQDWSTILFRKCVNISECSVL